MSSKHSAADTELFNMRPRLESSSEVLVDNILKTAPLVCSAETQRHDTDSGLGWLVLCAVQKEFIYTASSANLHQ